MWTRAPPITPRPPLVENFESNMETKNQQKKNDDLLRPADNFDFQYDVSFVTSDGPNADWEPASHSMVRHNEYSPQICI